MGAVEVEVDVIVLVEVEVEVDVIGFVDVELVGVVGLRATIRLATVAL